MNLANIKLVVTDMDGTLLNSKHEVSPLFFKLFKALTKHNVLFVVASGRPYYGMLEKLRPIKDHITFVSENGGLALHNNNVFLSNPIKKNNLGRIIKTINNIENAHPVFCTKQKAYILDKSRKLLPILSEYYHNYNILLEPENIECDIYKIALFHPENSEKYIYPHVKHLEPDFKVKLSAKHWVDISEIIANKGTALKKIQHIHAIAPDQTMVFGDYINDLEMMEHAYFSYAMENAHPLIKSVARFKTESNDNLGVETVLKKLLLHKEKLVSNL